MKKIFLLAVSVISLSQVLGMDMSSFIKKSRNIHPAPVAVGNMIQQHIINLKNRNLNKITKYIHTLLSMSFYFPKKFTPKQIIDLANQINGKLDNPISKFALAKAILGQNEYKEFVSTELSRANKLSKELGEQLANQLDEQFFNSVNNGDGYAMLALLQLGANINFNDNGITALMNATRKGYADIIRILIKEGADIYLQDNKGRSALMYAVDNGNTDILNILIDAGTDLNLQDNDDSTALMYAAKTGLADIVKILKAADANLNLKNKYGKTALAYAIESGHDNIVEILKSAEVNPI